jgi:excisionase family DNA binding protein
VSIDALTAPAPGPAEHERVDRIARQALAVALELVRSGSAGPDLGPAARPAPAAAATGATARTLSLGQAARALGISATTARRWADGGRLRATRTAGGHRRFATSEIRRLLAERGRAAVAPAQPPRRALPALADLVAEHGAELAQLSWRGLYGELRDGYFAGPEGAAAAERWLAALASTAATASYALLHEATGAFTREAEQAGASLLERHLALERFGETATRALARRASREEIVESRRLFAGLVQRHLADAG